jgi:hypothetical protein
MLREHTGDKPPTIGVWRMVAALVAAAFLGGALGLIWQSAGFGEDEEAAVAATQADAVEP